MKIFVLLGPNTTVQEHNTMVLEQNLQGTHEQASDELLKEQLIAHAKTRQIDLTVVHSTHEGDTLDQLHSTFGLYDGLIMNPGAYASYSIAVRDAISAINMKTIEVHLTNVYQKELLSNPSMTAPVCDAVICGFGTRGYFYAMDFLHEQHHRSKRR